MALTLAKKEYEPCWDQDEYKCVDLNNSELKKKYGETVNIICCGGVFEKRQGLLQHFKSKKHQEKCLQKKTEEFRQILPSNISIEELAKEIRDLKILYRKKCDDYDIIYNEMEKMKERSNTLNEKLIRLTGENKSLRIKPKPKKILNIIDMPNLINLGH